MAKLSNHLKKQIVNGDIDIEKDTLTLRMNPKTGVAEIGASPQKKWLDFNFNLFRRNQEMSIKPMLQTRFDHAIIYKDNGKPSKMWDIETPMVMPEDDQIIAILQ